MLNRKQFWQVDVFAQRPLAGNPAAVVFEADDLSKETMQAIAREMNLSETVFLVRPTKYAADYAVRIFTPRNEIPFAGHPTLAAAFVHASRHKLASCKLTQECGRGLIPVSSEDGFFVMDQMPPSRRSVDLSASDVATLLGTTQSAFLDLPLEIVSTGVEWLLAPLRSHTDVARLEPDLRAIEMLSRRLDVDGVIAFSPSAHDPNCRVRLRTFAPIQGIAEDPACGSGNGSVGSYIEAHHLFADRPANYWAEQGVEIERPSRIFVATEGTRVRVGGAAVLAAEGTLYL